MLKRRGREVITKGKNPFTPSLLFLYPVWLGALHKQVKDLLTVFPVCQSNLLSVYDGLQNQISYEWSSHLFQSWFLCHSFDYMSKKNKLQAERRVLYNSSWCFGIKTFSRTRLFFVAESKER